MDVVDRLARSIEQVRPLMAGTDVDQLDLSTPCPEWTVKDLLNHLIGALVMFRDAAGKGEFDTGAMSADHVAAGIVDAFDHAAKESVDAIRAKGVEGTITLPFGELPCEFAYALIADDVLVHGWDLAMATGQTSSGIRRSPRRRSPSRRRASATLQSEAASSPHRSRAIRPPTR